MTRQTWTTSEQKEWLEARKEGFLEAKQKDTTSKEFFPVLTKEFREKWPVPPVTNDEISNAGSADLAMKIKRDNYDKVHAYYFKRRRELTKAYVAFTQLVS
jgi:predicted metal-dependent hydrolase